MWSYLAILVVALLPRNTEQLKLSTSDPKIVADSYLTVFNVEQSWIKFKDLPDEEKDEVLEEVEGGFIFFNLFIVQIHCQAPYPVEWRMDNLQEDVGTFSMQTYTQRNGSLAWTTPDNWSFTAVLRLYALRQFVGVNYTCRGMSGNSRRQASTSVYSSVLGQDDIAEAGKKFNVSVYGRSVAVLPCRLTYVDNNVHVMLFRKLEKEDWSFTWSLMKLNNSVVYDSRVGFSLSVKDLPGIVGDYRCLVNGSEAEDEAVHFTISNTPTTKTVEDDLSPRMELQGSAKMWWKGGDQYEFFCCSNSKDPPKLRVMGCSNPAQCSYAKVLLGRMKNKKNLFGFSQVAGVPTQNCSRSFVYSPIFMVQCKGEGINVVETYHYTFKNAGVPELKDRGGSYVHFNLTTDIDFIPASIPTKGSEEKMIKMVYFKSKTVRSLGVYGEQRSMIMQDRSGRPDDFMYTGTNVTFRCYYSTYVFAIGGYWTVKWKTGDSKLFPGNDESLGGLHLGELQSILSLTMKLERELESVACGLSVMNTSEWKFRETKVSVKDPVAPSFKVKEEEIVWKLRSKNVTLECDLSGIPVSNKATWRKDGKEIRLEHSKLMRIVLNGLKSVLAIPEVSHEMHGEFSCESMNVAGTAVKVFHVYVEEESSETGLALLGVSISLVFVGGVAFVLWKFGLDYLKKMFAKKL